MIATGKWVPWRWLMFDRVPTARARHLSQELALLVEKSGRNQMEMAALLAWSPSKLNRLLNGKRMVSQVDLATFLALCGVVGQNRDELLAFAEDAYTPMWCQDYGASPPICRQTLTDNESIATTITTYHSTLVPDLLQSPTYTRALLHALPTISDQEVDERALETARRQRILDRKFPPVVRFFLDDHVLARSDVDDVVMSDQAHHLLQMAIRPDVELRIVPAAAGIRYTTPFTLLEFNGLPTVAYVELPTSAVFLEHDDTVTAYQRLVADLDRRALDKDHSRAWLASVSESWSTRRQPNEHRTSR